MGVGGGGGGGVHPFSYNHECICSADALKDISETIRHQKNQLRNSHDSKLLDSYWRILCTCCIFMTASTASKHLFHARMISTSVQSKDH